MQKDLLFDLESSDSRELECNSDVSENFLVSDENGGADNEDIAELRAELQRLERLRDTQEK